GGAWTLEVKHALDVSEAGRAVDELDLGWRNNPWAKQGTSVEATASDFLDGHVAPYHFAAVESAEGCTTQRCHITARAEMDRLALIDGPLLMVPLTFQRDAYSTQLPVRHEGGPMHVLEEETRSDEVVVTVPSGYVLDQPPLDERSTSPHHDI